MPHNRPEREKEIRDRYEFVVFDGEWSSVHAILAVIDGYYTGGSITWEVVKSEMMELFGDVAQAMIAHGLDPVNEPIYIDKMIFQNWEKEFGIRLPLPNKFVPYVAARKKSSAIIAPDQVHNWFYWFFKGDRCMLYDHEQKEVQWNMEMDNSKGFPDAWTKLDAAASAGDKKYWFFKGNRCMLYDYGQKKVIWNMQMDNSKGFPGAWTKLDAAASAGDKKYWFFKGDRCMLYDHEQKEVQWNMQMDNSKGFPGAWTKLDAAASAGDKKYWFFKGNRCMLYDYGQKKVIWNMQMDNSKGFPGAWTKLDAVLAG